MQADTMRCDAVKAVNPNVEHPAHYGGGDNPFECIKVLAAWLTPEQMSGFLIGNVIKYLSRAGKKSNRIEDLEKAAWYLQREIDRLKTVPKPTTDFGEI